MVVAACARRVHIYATARRTAAPRLRLPAGAAHWCPGRILSLQGKRPETGRRLRRAGRGGTRRGPPQVDGSYDVAVAGVGAEALAWHEYRVGQDGAVERAALAVVENRDAERIVSPAAWANLAAAPAGAKRGQSDAVAAARACYAAALPFFASGRRPTHGGGFAPVLAPRARSGPTKPP